MFFLRWPRQVCIHFTANSWFRGGSGQSRPRTLFHVEVVSTFYCLWAGPGFWSIWRHFCEVLFGCRRRTLILKVCMGHYSPLLTYLDVPLLLFKFLLLLNHLPIWGFLYWLQSTIIIKATALRICSACADARCVSGRWRTNHSISWAFGLPLANNRLRSHFSWL